ncbi:MAG: hypothetical protein ACU0CO_08075 [Shimia sp.]
MADEPEKTIDSTQPEADVTVNEDTLTAVTPGEARPATTEEVDRDDPPVADLARELPPEVKDAVRQEGTWEDPDDARNHGDMAQEADAGFDDKS